MTILEAPVCWGTEGSSQEGDFHRINSFKTDQGGRQSDGESPPHMSGFRYTEVLGEPGEPGDKQEEDKGGDTFMKLDPNFNLSGSTLYALERWIEQNKYNSQKK